MWHRQAQIQSSYFIGIVRKSIEQTYCWLLKGLRCILTLEQIIGNNKWIEKLTRWIKPLEPYIVTCFISYTYIVLLIIGTLDILRLISIEAYHASIRRFCNRLRHCTNARILFSMRSEDVFTILMLTFFIFVFASAIICFFFVCLFVLFCFFCNICIGKIWCSLFKISETQPYWLFFSFSWVDLPRAQSQSSQISTTTDWWWCRVKSMACTKWF